MTLAAVLLAAGASRRFGTQNKLLADLRGAPLVSYAATSLRGAKPDFLIAVVRSDAVAAYLGGYQIVFPQMSDPAQGDSLKAGVARAESLGADRIMVTLGDMPFVSAELIADVAALCTDGRPSATTDGTKNLPPACFPASCFPALLALRGDRGAGNLVRDLPPYALIRASPDQVQDIDTPEALTALNP